MKILALQFRYLGDAVLMTPALRALKEKFAGCSLHVLVAEEVVPLLAHLPWVTRVWSFPRRRGKANLKQAWPVFRALRRERFDCSVDFVGSDRGALVSLLCGARRRIGPLRKGGFVGRRLCYTESVFAPLAAHESQTNFGVLSAFGITAPVCPVLEICADPGRANGAQQLLPGRPILCHLATSQPKKEWPLEHWIEFHCLALRANYETVFCAGTSPREQALLAEFQSRSGGAAILPPIPELATFLAVLNQARLFISGDTGPLHFAAGLGVPTISLFGPSSLTQWAPLGSSHRALKAGACACHGNTAVCLHSAPCMASISPETVLLALQELLPAATLPHRT